MKIYKEDVRFQTDFIDAFEGVSLVIGKYMDETDCLAIMYNGSDAGNFNGVEIISTNLSEYGLQSGEGYFYIKNYGHHEGLAHILADMGIAIIMGEYKINYGTFHEVGLVGYHEWFDKQNKKENGK